MGDFVTSFSDIRSQPLASRSFNYGLIGIVFALLAVIGSRPVFSKALNLSLTLTWQTCLTPCTLKK